jgi:hypothetical protein
MEKSLSSRGAGANLIASLLLLVLAFLGVAAYLGTIRSFFLENAPLNSVIVAVFATGACYALFRMARLQSQFRLLEKVRERFALDDGVRWLRRESLASMAPSCARERLMLYSSQVHRGCPPDGDSHAEQLAMTLDLHAAITRYIAGLLVFLGLLGTFIGLLLTLDGVGQLIQGIGPALAGETGDLLDGLRDRLALPIQGMATAFSTSVFGLVSSLIVGFLHLQLASAQTRFLSRFEMLDAALFVPAFIGQAPPSGRGAQQIEPSASAPTSASQDASVSHVTEGIARYMEATQRQLSDNLDRLMSIVERTEGMQSSFREVLALIGRQIETTNASISCFGTNQDLIRGALGKIVDISRAESEDQSLMLSELRTMNESLARSAAQHETTLNANRDEHQELLRVLRREVGTLDKMTGGGGPR